MTGKRISPKIKKRIKEVLRYAVCCVWLFVCVFPFYWSIVTALKPAGEIMTLSLWPKHVSWENFANVFGHKDLLKGLGNTVAVTLATMTINIAVSLLAGYAFARIKFRGRNVLFKIMESSMMLPFAVVFIPTFIILARFPLVGGNNILGQGGVGFVGQNTMFMGLILPSCISVYNIFFLKQFFMTLSDEFGESAKLDGAGELRIFGQIYLPLIAPAVATLAIFTFQSGWNNFFWPNIISQGQFIVLTMVLRSFYTQVPADQGGGMAASLVIIFPMLVVFLVFQRYFMSGLTAGGVKD